MASITSTPLQVLSSLSLLLLVVCTCARSLPITNTSNSAEVLTACPTQDPAELLGERRHHLQHFTPDLLCGSSKAVSSQANLAGNSLEGKSASPSPVSISGDSHARIAGCSPAELEDLSMSDASTEACPFHLTCQYDPLRYPAVMYEAKRTSQTSSCPVDSACLPVVKEVEVMRKESQSLNEKSCPMWRLSLEYITTGFQCQQLFGMDDETSNSGNR